MCVFFFLVGHFRLHHVTHTHIKSVNLFFSSVSTNQQINMHKRTPSKANGCCKWNTMVYTYANKLQFFRGYFIVDLLLWVCAVIFVICAVSIAMFCSTCDFECVFVSACSWNRKMAYFFLRDLSIYALRIRWCLHDTFCFTFYMDIFSYFRSILCLLSLSSS